MIGSRLEDLAGLLRETENRASAAQPCVIRPSLNMNRCKSGDPAIAARSGSGQHIATTLSTPRKEVELLLKVHNLSLENASEPKA